MPPPVPHRTLLKEYESQGCKLPPIMFLQFDNCTRENKNWIMFSYLCWLVESRVTKKIHVGFLVVG